MTLHTDIKNIIEEYGNDILRSTRLANILADTSDEFKDNPAIKNIFKDMLADGVGSSILALEHEAKKTRSLRCQALATDFVKKRGYNTTVVRYLTDCIQFALGWIDAVVPMDVEAAPDRRETTTSNINNKVQANDLQKTLEALKLDYVNSLGSYYTYPVNRFFYTKPGYFSADAASKLSLIEQKIDIVAQALGVDMKNWCLKQKELFEENNQVSISAIKKQIRTRLVTPVLVLLIVVGSVGFKVRKSQVEENFYPAMQNVESALNSSDYDNAFAQCMTAKEVSKLFLGLYIHKSETTAKLEQILSAKEESLVKDGKFDEAVNWLNSLSQQYSSDNAVVTLLKNHQESLIERKTTELNEGLPQLIDDISRNAGKLSVAGQAALRRLLVMDPENYWLKIIKARELK